MTDRAQPWEREKGRRGVLSPGSEWSEPLIDRILEGCHPKQRDFVLDPADRIAARVGRGGGKTTGGKARFLIKMLRTTRASCAFVATTKTHAQLLMWEPIKLTCERLGLQFGKDVTFNETKLWFRIVRTGSMLQLVGADDKSEIDKLRGQPFDECGIDEAAVHKPAILENLVDRVLAPRLRGALWMVSTPWHVLSGYFYDATRPGSEFHRPYADRDRPEYEGWDGWSSHFWTLNDPDAQRIEELRMAWDRALREKKRKGWGDSHPVWRREYLGEFAADNTGRVYAYTTALEAGDDRGPEGTPWNQWDPPRIRDGWFVDLAKAVPGVKDWHYSIGLDKGNKDPFACNVFAFSPQEKPVRFRHVWGMEKLGGGMYPSKQAEMLIGEDAAERMRHGKEQGKLGGVLGQTGWPDGFIADSDQDTLDELRNTYGIAIQKAERNRDSKIGGIELVNGGLVSGEILILKGSALETELLNLQWKPDENGLMKEDPAQANHGSDTLTYSRRAVAHLLIGDEKPSKERPKSSAYTDPQGLGASDDEPAERGGSFDSLYEAGDMSDRWGGGDD